MHFEHGCWHAQFPGVGIPIVLSDGQDGPDSTLKIRAVEAVRNIRVLEERGREYLRASQAPVHRTLASLEVFRPASEWAHQAPESSDRFAVDDILAGGPLVSITFVIAGDRNVVDVIFFDTTPLGFEYH